MIKEVLIWVCIIYLTIISYKINKIQKPINKTYIIESSFKMHEDIVRVTGYNATVNQCDSTPFITASNKRVKLGMVAVSRDLEKKYNLKFGDFVYLEGYGIFEFQDRLHKRKKKQVDIYCLTKKDAYKVTKDNVPVIFIKRK